MGTTQELVPYVDDMQLEFAVDPDNDAIPDSYEDADFIRAGDAQALIAELPDLLKSVKITLTIRVPVGNILPGQVLNAANEDQFFVTREYTRVVQFRNNTAVIDLWD